MKNSKRQEIIEMFSNFKVLRPRDLEAVGISGVYLNKLYAEGVLERPSRGIYTLKGTDFDQNQSLIEAYKQVPNSAVCLISALQFHGLTTQIPFEVWLAIDVKARLPKVNYPPIRICRFSGEALTSGIQEHKIHNTIIRVYDPAKTVADCFKYRNKIGLDVALEALRDVWAQKRATMDELFKAAKVCRVANVMRPYLESLV